VSVCVVNRSRRNAQWICSVTHALIRHAVNDEVLRLCGELASGNACCALLPFDHTCASADAEFAELVFPGVMYELVSMSAKRDVHCTSVATRLMSCVLDLLPARDAASHVVTSTTLTSSANSRKRKASTASTKRRGNGDNDDDDDDDDNGTAAKTRRLGLVRIAEERSVSSMSLPATQLDESVDASKPGEIAHIVGARTVPVVNADAQSTQGSDDDDDEDDEDAVNADDAAHTRQRHSAGDADDVDEDDESGCVRVRHPAQRQVRAM
jgi:hypothetical protein